MEKLRLEAKEQEYKRLINPTPQYSTLYDKNWKIMIWHQLPTSTERIEKSINHNYKCFISVGSVSYAIWYWTETSWGLPVSYRALLSVFSVF